MAKQGTRSVIRSVGMAFLGAFAGVCLGLFLGTPVVAFFLQGDPDQYYIPAAVVGAMAGTVLGMLFGAVEIVGDARQKLFRPPGMLLGLVCGAVCGATFAYSFVFSEHSRDIWDSTVVTCVLMILGGVGGGFLGRTGWAMISGAMGGLIIVGIAGVMLFHHILGVMYGAFLGAPIGTFIGFLLAREGKEKGGSSGGSARGGGKGT